LLRDPAMSIQSGTIPIAIVGEPGPTLASWAPVEHCPACGSNLAASATRLPDRHYVFGGQRVPFPGGGIPLTCCGVCATHYKSVVPSPGFLAGLFRQYAEAKWTAPPCDFSRDVRLLRQLWGARSMDLLDIGAAGGGLLQAHAESGLAGRRSAFDVMRYAGVERHLTGEFIEGFLDDPIAAWSGEPYDVVTLFDVVEHFYRPKDAFENLRRLTRPGGLVFLETGDAESYWPRRFGINEWWYVRLIEHHLFWSRRSLEFVAQAHGFRIVYWKRGRHKSRRGRFSAGMFGDFLKSGVYRFLGRQYAAMARACGRQGNQPWYPFAHDHFQACLMRE
jgi:SAM-dependent methyltransferase